MSDDDLVFARLIFCSVLSIQYHPRNAVPPEDDLLIIRRCLRIANLAVHDFREHFTCDDDIPF